MFARIIEWLETAIEMTYMFGVAVPLAVIVLYFLEN